MIQLETKNRYCKCHADVKEFAGKDAVTNAAVEIKGALYSMIITEMPLLQELTGENPKSILEQMDNVIGFDKVEFLQFAATAQGTQGN